MKLYKLTDRDGYTQRHNTGETLWTKGKTLELKPCDNPRLCTKQVVHAYTNPNLALLLNPCHVNLSDPLLWEAEGDVVVKDWGPEWYANKDTKKRVVIQFAILCAESVIAIFEKQYPDDDRPRKAIEVARKYLKNPAAADAADAAAYAAVAAYAVAAKIDFAMLADIAAKAIATNYNPSTGEWKEQ